LRDIEFSQILLTWYDANARVMPWRISPAKRAAGILPDPYRVWLSEVMLQQTTVAAVHKYFHNFTTRWPTVTALANARDSEVMDEWAGLGYYARARNLLKCARMVRTRRDGIFPETYSELLELPGIGPYTAAAISAIAFDHRETVLDGNVERVMSRYYLVETPLPTAKPELRSLASCLTPDLRPGDYAQAIMDLGATVCTPRSPSCGSCPLLVSCRAYTENSQNVLPRKVPRKPKPVRKGIAYLGQRTDGAWLLERRPDKGLLGGMLGWPGSNWGEQPEEFPPTKADWHNPGLEVRHTFTHFHLILSLRIAKLSAQARSNTGQFIQQGDFHPSDLPTVMRKAYELATPIFTVI